MKSSPGQVEITFEYSRHPGPKFNHGGVTLSFDALQPYSFTSLAEWPQGWSAAEVESAIRESVEHVLRTNLGGFEKVKVVLKAVRIHPFDSSIAGFRTAARIATEAAFTS